MRLDDGLCRDCVIRALRPEDELCLQTFYNGLDTDAKTLFRPLGWSAALDECEKIVRDMLDGKRYDIVIDLSGRIKGWAFAAELDRDYPVFGIGLTDRLRGQGFGRRMMAEVIDHVRAKGNKGLDLTVVQTNDRARTLYERFSFQVRDKLTGTDGLEYYSMRLEFQR